MQPFSSSCLQLLDPAGNSQVIVKLLLYSICFHGISACICILHTTFQQCHPLPMYSVMFTLVHLHIPSHLKLCLHFECAHCVMCPAQLHLDRECFPLIVCQRQPHPYLLGVHSLTRSYIYAPVEKRLQLLSHSDKKINLLTCRAACRSNPQAPSILEDFDQPAVTLPDTTTSVSVAASHSLHKLLGTLHLFQALQNQTTISTV